MLYFLPCRINNAMMAGGRGGAWKFVCLAARLSGDNTTAALLPMAAEAGDRGCRPAWAGQRLWGEGGGWRGGGSCRGLAPL